MSRFAFIAVCGVAAAGNLAAALMSIYRAEPSHIRSAYLAVAMCLIGAARREVEQ